MQKSTNVFKTPEGIAVVAIPEGDDITEIEAGVYQLSDVGPDSVNLKRVGEYLEAPSYRYGAKTPMLDPVHTIHKDMSRNLKSGKGSISAMFDGPKGNGKSVMANALANRLIKDERTVVVIDRYVPIAGLKVLVSLLPRCVILIDEFEKKYTGDERSDDRLELLEFLTRDEYCFSLIMTANDIGDEYQLMLERPGRMKYRHHCGSIPMHVFEDFIEYEQLEEYRIILQAYYESSLAKAASKARLYNHANVRKNFATYVDTLGGDSDHRNSRNEINLDTLHEIGVMLKEAGSQAEAFAMLRYLNVCQLQYITGLIVHYGPKDNRDLDISISATVLDDKHVLTVTLEGKSFSVQIPSITHDISEAEETLKSHLQQGASRAGFGYVGLTGISLKTGQNLFNSPLVSGKLEKLTDIDLHKLTLPEGTYEWDN